MNMNDSEKTILSLSKQNKGELNQDRLLSDYIDFIAECIDKREFELLGIEQQLQAIERVIDQDENNTTASAVDLIAKNIHSIALYYSVVSDGLSLLTFKDDKRGEQN